MQIDLTLFEALTDAGIKPDAARRVERSVESAILQGHDASRVQIQSEFLTKSDALMLIGKISDRLEKGKDELYAVKDELKADTQSLRDELHAVKDELKADTQSLRDELHAVKDELKADTQSLREELYAVKSELKADTQALRVEMYEHKAELKSDIQLLRNDVHKISRDLTWRFVGFVCVFNTATVAAFKYLH